MDFMKKSEKPEKLKEGKFPRFCDYSCKYARFAPSASTGACRRELQFGVPISRNSITRTTDVCIIDSRAAF